MSIDRNQRTSFDEVSDLYEERRSDYPTELIDDILELSRILQDGTILEIGCEPGNATLPFAKRWYMILAIELGERLDAIAPQNCRAHPKVDLRALDFISGQAARFNGNSIGEINF